MIMIIIIIRIRILTITMLLLKTLGLSGLGGRGIREGFIHNKDASIFASWGERGGEKGDVHTYTRIENN